MVNLLPLIDHCREMVERHSRGLTPLQYYIKMEVMIARLLKQANDGINRALMGIHMHFNGAHEEMQRLGVLLDASSSYSKILKMHRAAKRIKQYWRLAKPRIHAARIIQAAWREHRAARHNQAARAIQVAWRTARLNPQYKMCQRYMAKIQAEWDMET